jgi:hypothetical protein
VIHFEERRVNHFEAKSSREEAEASVEKARPSWIQQELSQEKAIFFYKRERKKFGGRRKNIVFI